MNLCISKYSTPNTSSRTNDDRVIGISFKTIVIVTQICQIFKQKNWKYYIYNQ